MVSEFRKKKLHHVFKFFDTDSSGVINKTDFELAFGRVAEKQRWEKDSPNYTAKQTALLNIWESLQKEADTDGDGEVTLQEWYDMWEQFAKNPTSPFEWQNLHCKFTFDVQDAGGDGAIDSEEYSSVLQLFGFAKEDAEAAFQKMAGGKEKVTWDEFQNLWKEYFASENPEDPGNSIFGLCKC